MLIEFIKLYHELWAWQLGLILSLAILLSRDYYKERKIEKEAIKILRDAMNPWAPAEPSLVDEAIEEAFKPPNPGGKE